MKKIIAKVLIAAMVLTTVIAPVEFGFAETGAKQSENGQVVVTAEAVEETIEETIEEEMQFLYLEQQQVEATGIQNIAVSWQEDIDAVTEMLLIYENGSGQQLELKENKRTENAILFTEEFDESETGSYTIKGIKYFINGLENYLDFDNFEIDADFEVVNEIAGEETDGTSDLVEEVENNMAVVNNTGSVIDNEAVQDQVEAVLEEVEAVKTSDDKNVVVVLDPGHGGNDSGATKKFTNGTILKESEINLKIANACYDELNKYAGITVYMTRTTDKENPTLEQRVKYAAKKNANVFVSLHINASTSSKASGTEVWTPNKNYKKTVYKDGQALSKSILDELMALGLDLDNRGIKTRDSETNPKTKYKDGSIADYYYVIKECKKRGFAGIIVEHAFITNSGDRKILTNDKNLKIIGVADALGIANHFNLSKGIWESTSNGKKYKYADGSYATGYIKIGSSYYYFDDTGMMETGFVKDGDNAYYFAKSGKGLKKGWRTLSSGKRLYSKGAGVLMVGYNKQGKYYYYFNSAGVMQKYTQMVNDRPYYFRSTGRAAGKGWIKYKNGTQKYCLGKGELATGYQKVGDYYYFFDSVGAMQKYTQMVDGKPYYFKSTGKAAGKGWIKHKNGRKKYCFGKGELAVGVVKIGKSYYKFSSKGTYLGKTKAPNYEIAGNSTVTVNQMVAYYKATRGTSFPKQYKKTEASTIEKFCKIYYDECKAEGIKVEVAFCQAMKETGWLKFGGDVSVTQYNFAGIGATGGGKQGHKFESVTMGIRGHVQHLKAYANNKKLANDCVDPRFHLVKRGAAPYVEWLGQKANPEGYGWAPAATYGTDIVKMIKTLKTY